MKTYFKLIFGAFLIGGLFAYLFYRDIKSEVNALESDRQYLYLFQVGVFQNPANAENYASNFDSSLVYKTDEYYRVLTCLTSSEENKDKLYEYFKKANINFYIKKEVLPNEMKNELNNMEKVLEKTTKKEVINEACQNLLDTFLSYS